MIGKSMDGPEPERCTLQEFLERTRGFDKNENGTFTKLGPPFEVVIIQVVEGGEVSYKHFTF